MKGSGGDMEERIKRLAGLAAEWRLLGLLFERPRPGWHDEVDRLAGEVADPALREAARAAKKARGEEHVGLFGPGGPCSPREVSYLGFREPGRILAELREFHKAFAFAPDTEEPADHVAVECAFTGYLCLKEAYALGGGDAGSAGTCAKARERFVERHLTPLGQGLAKRLEGAGPDWVRHAAQALRSRLPALVA